MICLTLIKFGCPSFFIKLKRLETQSPATKKSRKEKGVFSTRSPHRPNRLGMTCVDLLNIKGLTLLLKTTTF